MGQPGWRDRFGPPSLALSTGLVIAIIFPAAISAEPPPAPRPPVACPSVDVGAAASRGAESARVTSALTTDANGTVTGRRLAVERAPGEAPLTVDLPAESFVATARGSLTVYGAHRPGNGSEIRAIDAESGCDVFLARPSEVVRSAILDPSGTALYVHSVAEDDRRDLGVTRHDLRTGAVTAALGPLEPSDRFGRTFATELRWSVEGDVLAVQSCGISACRTRTLGTASGDVTTFAEAHGSLIGLTRDSLYAFEACHGLPCGVLAIDQGSGDSALLAEEAYSAALTSRDGLVVLFLETAAGTQEIVQ